MENIQRNTSKESNLSFTDFSLNLEKKNNKIKKFLQFKFFQKKQNKTKNNEINKGANIKRTFFMFKFLFNNKIKIK